MGNPYSARAVHWYEILMTSIRIPVAAIALGLAAASGLGATASAAPIGNGACAPRANADCTGLKAPGANLRGKDLRGARFITADLRNADLRGANLSRVQFRNVNMTGADLRGANLNRASLRGVALINVRMDGATMRYAHIGAPTRRRANAHGETASTATTPTPPSGTGTATGCGLRNYSDTCTLNGVTLSGTFCAVPFNAAIIENSTLSGSFGTTSKCPKAASFAGTVQTNNNWTGANLTGVNFSYSTITSSDFISVQANGTYWHYTVGKYNDFTSAVYGTDNDFADVDMQFATCPDGFQGEFVNGPCVTVI